MEAKRTISLPAQDAIAGTVLGSDVRQLRRSRSREEVTFARTTVGRSEYDVVHRADGSAIILAGRRFEPPDRSDALLVVDLEALVSGASDIADGKWLSPAPVSPTSMSILEANAATQSVLRSWKNAFRLLEERRIPSQPDEPGLRPPQIGAVYAVLAHWRVSTGPATVVMPTGTGKTETMLALLVHERLQRLMVVVPTSALREQISKKFLELGLLRELQLLDAGSLAPIVGTLRHKPKSIAEVDEIFLRCNVIVTTMAIAGQVEEPIKHRMSELCTHLFVDEAHHISAPTWEALRSSFSSKPVVQFTATPFRGDGKHVDGRMVFNYPLRKAQSEGYFRSIRFTSVDEIDQEDADLAIARTAIATLQSDLSKGLSHIVMARCADISRASEVLEIYKAEGAAYSPAILHNRVPKTEATETLRNMRAGASRIVVCVDMLGEGFDLPELKIAALHDPHKSLAVMLQFTGRFTRHRNDLGDATVIANIADPILVEGLRDLYAEDADWNVLLRGLSEDANTRQARRAEFLDQFRNMPEDISFQNLFPRLGAVTYRMSQDKWRPEKVADILRRYEVVAGPAVNEQQKLLVFVTREQTPVAWGELRGIQDTEWQLYLVFWDQSSGLLFINSSSTGSVHEGLAKAVGGDGVRLIRGEEVFRSLHGVSRLVLTNLGLSDIINHSLRFSMHAGRDISDALPEALRMNKKKSNLFARGFENGEKVSVGCSQKGRIWSMTTAEDLPQWVDWCRATGAKLLNPAVSTDGIFRNVILPESVVSRPGGQVPILVDWPDRFWAESEDAIEISFDGKKAFFYEVELQVLAPSEDGPIQFAVVMDDASASYSVRFGTSGVTYERMGGPDALIKIGKSVRGLGESFMSDPPPIRFHTGAYLEGDELFRLPVGRTRQPFDVDKIEAWDWTGVDLRKESQGLEKISDSIQRRVVEKLLAETTEAEFPIIFDDDGSGEVADVVCIGVRGSRLLIRLYHCKYSGEAAPGSRIDDLYVVCGQAQRSVNWRSQIGEIFKHLRRRESRRQKNAADKGVPHVSRFERGSVKSLRTIERQAMTLTPEMTIFIVQPGLSKGNVSSSQTELLAVSELYLAETAALSMIVVASA